MGRGNSTEFIELMLGVQSRSDEAFIELYEGQVKNAILSMYKPEIIKEHFISDILINPDSKGSNKFVVKFKKRYIPLSDEQLLDKFGVKVETDGVE